VKRFIREAKLLSAFEHHHLVTLYNFGLLDDGRLFLAMEYGGSITLETEIERRGRIEPARAELIAEQVCNALHEAHRHGVVHRDLKPANILLGQKNGRDWAKVVDVGIARILESSRLAGGDPRLTGEGKVVGTPSY